MQNSNDQTTKQRRKDIASFSDDYDGWALGAMATLAESGLDEAISELDPSIEGKRSVLATVQRSRRIPAQGRRRARTEQYEEQVQRRVRTVARWTA